MIQGVRKSLALAQGDLLQACANVLPFSEIRGEAQAASPARAPHICQRLRDNRYSIAFSLKMSTHPEQVRCYAYRCVVVAVRNRQNQLRPSSLLWPVATGHAPNTTPLTLRRFSHPASPNRFFGEGRRGTTRRGDCWDSELCVWRDRCRCPYRNAIVFQRASNLSRH